MSSPGRLNKLRLCYVADLRSVHTQRWVSYFAQRGHSVTVLSPTRMELPGVKVHSIFWKPGLPKILQLANVVPILSVLRAVKPHVLHAHYVRVYGWLAALSYFKPLVITVWGGDILEDQGAFSDLFARKLTPFALRRAAAVTAHSKFLMKRVIELGKPESRVHMVGCPGVDRRQFKRGLNTDSLRCELTHEQASERQQIHELAERALERPREQVEAASENGPFILCTRLMDKLYNTETIINAIPFVLREVPGTKFIFSEYAGEKAYILDMKALVKRLAVEASAIFLKTIPHERMPLFLNLAHVFVSIPDSDGMPQSLLEAMACGTVPVVSDLPQYSELIKNETNALVLPSKDAQALAKTIIRLLRDNALREKLSRACVDTIVDGMDYEVEMQKMESLYYKLSRVGG